MLIKNAEFKAYNLEGLLKLLPNYHLAKIETCEETEDWASTQDRYYLTKRDDIKSIKVSFSLAETRVITFNDESMVRTVSSNLSSKDMKLIYTIGYPDISPMIQIDGVTVVLTEDLQKWILNMGVPFESLLKIIETYEKEFEYEYYGIYELCPMKNAVYVSGAKNMVLTTSQIQTILDDIEDETLRRSVEAILTAPFFYKRPNRERC